VVLLLLLLLLLLVLLLQVPLQQVIGNHVQHSPPEHALCAKPLQALEDRAV
jgi:hypothetical protein